MSLTKENYDRLSENFLYKKTDNSFLFGVYKEAGRVWLVDTYFGWRYEEITDKNIDDLSVV